MTTYTPERETLIGSPEITLIDVAALRADTDAMIIEALEGVDAEDHTHNLTIDGIDIGRAGVRACNINGQNGVVIEYAAEVETLDINNRLYNHSAYSKILKGLMAPDVAQDVIYGYASNEATAITLDLDTLSQISADWSTIYYVIDAHGAITELAYPIEVYDHLSVGEHVYHKFVRKVDPSVAEV